MDRRELIHWLVATAGLQCLEAREPDELLALGAELHRGTQGYRALSPRAQRMVVAAAERIIPATDTPGATDAAVAPFIDRMLADWYTAAERDRFLAGLRELDERCIARRRMPFADCNERDQVEVLTAFDTEALGRGRANPNEHWFAMLKYLTVWGYCTSAVGMRETLAAWPLPGRYDGCAPVTVRRARSGA